MRKVLSIVTVLCLFVLSTVEAGWFGKSFSAELVQQAPQQPLQFGKMYVSGSKVRQEYSTNNTIRVEIVDPEQGVAYMLDPQRQIYIERPIARGEKTPKIGERSDSPCDAMPQLRCRMEGEEAISGRMAKRWTVEGVENKPATVWTDKEHGFAVQQRVAGKVVSSMSYLGSEIIGGRETEKWQATTLEESGRQVVTLQWYDPQLNVAIRQQHPGGYVREMRNIRLGEQSASLFQVPAGYRLVQGADSGR